MAAPPGAGAKRCGSEDVGHDAPLFPGPHSPHGVEGFDGGPRESGYHRLYRVNGRPQRPYTWRERAKKSFTVVNPELAHPQGQWLDLVLTALAQPIPVGANQPPLRGRRAQPNSGVRRERPGDPFPWGEI